MDGALDIATLVAALGCGLNAGIFFAFSTFVMDGLARADAPTGIAAMQSINRRAPTTPFMLVWLGTALLCAVLAVWTAGSSGDERTILAVAAAAIYLAGSIALTFARNIPLNDALDRMDPADAATARFWREYVRRWTALNHVRTAASLAGAALLTIALAGG
jgi:uncharacterized membrane protein